MALAQFINVDYSVGGPLLLDKVNLTIERHERICIVGRNGAGKSTLLRLLNDQIAPDDGEIRKQSGISIAQMSQEVPQDTQGRVFDVVAQGLGDIGEMIRHYHEAIDNGNMQDMARWQSQIERNHGWDLDRLIDETIDKLLLNPEQNFNALSGGMKRRVLLAQALVGKPDILLLDEPTNHLDISSITWLESFLQSYTGTIVFVTHDRAFLRKMATRIVAIDRGEVTDWPGDYTNFLRRQEERQHAEELAHAAFDKKLKQEEAWIRQGIKARRTRNEGRVRALKAMRMERGKRREHIGKSQMQLTTGQASGKKVITLENIHYAFPDRCLIDDFSTRILRGDRIGIIGPNGSGKSTLIKIMLGKLVPQRGEVTLGSNINLAYFDQHRLTLNEDLSAIENVAEGREFIEVNGKRTHIMGYMQNFLFAPERALAPITRLSGGERNRLLLAKLFAAPSNLLIMDEPTNDLDVETLELLEDLLSEYQGTLLLVSHDRQFLDNVVTSTLVLEGHGHINEYVGGYADIPQHALETVSAAPGSAKKAPQSKPATQANKEHTSKPAKLSYNEQRELSKLPEKIESLEKDMARISQIMQSPDFYTQDSEEIRTTTEQLDKLQASLDAAYERWEMLESK